MGKLKAFRYLRNNKKQAAILVISFGLYFALIYGVYFFINPMHYTDKEIYLGNAQKMQSVYVQNTDKLPMDTSLWEESSKATEEDKRIELNRALSVFADELEKDNRIDYVIQCYTYGMRVRSFTGYNQYNTPLVSKSKARLICDYLDVKLVEGRYPEVAGDIILNERMAKNVGVKVGDILPDSSIKVCGIVSSKSYFAVGIETEEKMEERAIFFLDQETIPDLKSFFSERGWVASFSNNAQIMILTDMVNGKKRVEELEEEMEQPLLVMCYVITFIMGIVLYFVYQLHVKYRYEEWCLYRSLGYSRRDIYLLALREFGICMIGSILLSLLCIALIVTIGGIKMNQMGISYQYWLPDTVKQLMRDAILLVGVLQIPVYQAMRHITTIDEIEDDI